MEPALSLIVFASLVLVADLIIGVVRDLVGNAGSLSLGGPLSKGITAAVCATALVLVPMRSQARAATPPPTVRISVASSSVAVPASASDSGTRVTETYTVVKGDSLWRIARELLVESDEPTDGRRVDALWRAIYERNRSVIGDDPNLILPGQVLSIPTV